VLAIEMRCDRCDRLRAFEQPPCAERHEPSCPEWICGTCGAALLVDPPLVVLRRARMERPHRRRLAA
jgi:hypothetical protein